MKKSYFFFIVCLFLVGKANLVKAQKANVTDSLALVDLYNSTGGASWATHTGWLAGSVSNWYGVTLDANGRVISLNLSINNLKGTIPSSLGNLASLQSLDLGINGLVGAIPSAFGSLSNLQSLDLPNNQLSGSIPSTLGNMAHLQHLNLASNNLSGIIPSTLGSLVNLQYLALWFNQLSGSIPSALGSLSNLQVLYLGYNQLSGVIPSLLGNLSNLQNMDLSNSQLSGTVPSSLGNLANLQYLTLNDNQLSGTIPSSLGSLANLQNLYLYDNQLSGTVPPSLGSLVKLVALYLHNNQLTGTIPPSLGNLANLKGLSINGNNFNFDGMELIVQKYSFANYTPQNTFLHTSFNISKLSVSAGGTLANNTYKWYNGANLVGTVTGDSTFAPSGAGRYSVTVTNSVATALRLNSDTLSVTALSGPATDSLALVDLYNSTNGPNWIIHTGWLAGPVKNWNGVTLDANNRVKGISLSAYKLIGTIPSSLGNLANLQYLYLNGNQLTGTIPSSLGSLANLQYLAFDGNQLTGTIPSTLGNLASLLYLSLYNNQLTGSIPISLGNLANLQNLFLYGNLLSGTIPSTLGNLANLQYMYLNDNQLSGTIPSTLSNLSSVIYITLYNNQLSGTIPASLGNLASLKGLYLFGNQLNFDGMELIVHRYSIVSYSPQNTILHVNSNSSKLSVSSGGTLANNTYNWYNGANLVGTVTGDSTFTPLGAGRYSVTVTNAIANALTLKSDTLSVLVAVSATDSLALVNLYNSTNGPNWTNHTAWLAGPVKNWYGVTLDANGRVISVLLGANKLSGTIPSSLGSLANLQTLDLSVNQLSGTIPDALGNLTNLTDFVLDANPLTGSLPSTFSQLVNLQILSISSWGITHLTGAIPSYLGNFTRLNELWLDGNSFTGPIPSSLGNLSYINVLTLNGNHLTGAVPPALANLAYLNAAGAIFALDNNYFNFDGLELIAQKFGAATYAPQDTILHTNFNNAKLSVSSGGTLANNTYKWYNGATLVSTLTGDSTFTPSTAGRYSVTVTNAVAKALTLKSDTFTVAASAPTITLFTPISAGAGATDTIKGKYFTGATAVSFGGTAAALFNVVADTVITAKIGSGTTGNVAVTTPGGTATKAGFTFVALTTPGVFSYTSPNVFTVGQAITALVPNITGTGGAVTGYAINPALPAGLVLNTTTGVISGTPTAVSVATTYTVTASNAAGSMAVSLVITVAACNCGGVWK